MSDQPFWGVVKKNDNEDAYIRAMHCKSLQIIISVLFQGNKKSVIVLIV